MKLSQLVDYLARLEEMSPTDSESVVQSRLDPVIHYIESQPWKSVDLLDKIKKSRSMVSNAYQSFDQDLESVKKQVIESIESLVPKYLANSYRLYETDLSRDTTEHVLGRRLELNEEKEEFLASRLKLRTDWRYPGLIIRPGLEKFIENLVPCDPLYVLDTSHSLLEPAQSKFNQVYRNRVRWSLLNLYTNPMLSTIPDGQIGFSVIYNFFHYTPFEVMKSLLVEMHKKLRPGGYLAFSFNDCDLKGAVELCERNFACFTPGNMVKTLCESLDYKIIFTYQIDAATTWIEMKKPGEIKSLRGGQALVQLKNHQWPRKKIDELLAKANELGIHPDQPKIDYDQLQSQVDMIISEREFLVRSAQRLQITYNDDPVDWESLRVRVEFAEKHERIVKHEEQLRIKQQQQAEEAARQKRLQEEKIVRAQAKNLNIVGWDTESIETLTSQIEYENFKIIQEASKNKDQEEMRRKKENLEKSYRDRARNLNITEWETGSFETVKTLVDQHMQELEKCRKEAVRLRLDRTDVIMTKYTLKDLKRAIKKWRIENERPST